MCNSYRWVKKWKWYLQGANHINRTLQVQQHRAVFHYDHCFSAQQSALIEKWKWKANWNILQVRQHWPALQKFSQPPKDSFSRSLWDGLKNLRKCLFQVQQHWNVGHLHCHLSQPSMRLLLMTIFLCAQQPALGQKVKVKSIQKYLPCATTLNCGWPSTFFTFHFVCFHFFRKYF